MCRLFMARGVRMKYLDIEKMWNGDTTNNSLYSRARTLGHSHREAVVYAVQGGITTTANGIEGVEEWTLKKHEQRSVVTLKGATTKANIKEFTFSGFKVFGCVTNTKQKK